MSKSLSSALPFWLHPNTWLHQIYNPTNINLTLHVHVPLTILNITHYPIYKYKVKNPPLKHFVGYVHNILIDWPGKAQPRERDPNSSSLLLFFLGLSLPSSLSIMAPNKLNSSVFLFIPIIRALIVLLLIPACKLFLFVDLIYFLVWLLCILLLGCFFFGY